MIKMCVAIAVFCIVFLPVPAHTEIPEYTVLRTTDKMVIDGKLDEADWESAKPVGDFIFPWWEKGEKTDVWPILKRDYFSWRYCYPNNKKNNKATQKNT